MRRNVTIGLARLGTATALLGFLLLVPTPALAQDDVTLTMARERFKEGVAYFDKKDFAKARVAFLQAYALKKHPAVLLNLAQSELRSGHEADAAKHFAQYLREHKDATDAERQGAETGLTAAKALVAEVTLSVDANGSEVYVDGDLEGHMKFRHAKTARAPRPPSTLPRVNRAA
jgi:tetratricopeptide (TPR) repeat protein